MKYIILTLSILWHTSILSQYSNYYSNIYIGQPKKFQSKVDINANINQNLNANINISGSIVEQKTITTIDYGALEIANALREKNRIQQQLINDAFERSVAERIAENPVAAFEYGYPIKVCLNDSKFFTKDYLKKFILDYEIKNFCMHYIIPHRILFNNVGPGKFQNVSDDGVITEIEFRPPFFFRSKDKNKFDLENVFHQYIVGKENEVGGLYNSKELFFLHKTEYNRADVFGSSGIKATLVIEDKFEYQIKDFYMSLNYLVDNGYENSVMIIFRGDKDEVDFEKLEGRRYYFRNLIQKIIATGYIDKIKAK